MSKFILSALPTMPALIAVEGEESRFEPLDFGYLNLPVLECLGRGSNFVLRISDFTILTAFLPSVRIFLLTPAPTVRIPVRCRQGPRRLF